jgi:hypothetical protein
MAAEIKTLTNADGSQVVYPRTTIEAVYGMENFPSELENKVPVTRTINGKGLGENIFLTASDVGATSFNTATISIATSKWSSNEATISCPIVTTSNTLIVAPAPSSYGTWGDCKIRATAQAAGTITFTCDEVPTAEVSVNIVALG